MAQCYCCPLSKYPNVDTGRGTVSAQLSNRRRRLTDYKQPLISRVQRHEKACSWERMKGCFEGIVVDYLKRHAATLSPCLSPPMQSVSVSLSL